jgi:hypothetical protein
MRGELGREEQLDRGGVAPTQAAEVSASGTPAKMGVVVGTVMC